MKKLCWLGAVLLLSSTAELTAQTTNPLKIGFGVNNGFLIQAPNGYALGGDFNIQKNITNRVALTASAGFNHYFFSTGGTHLDTEGPSKAIPWNSIPLKAGVKAFVNDHVYIAGEAGASLFLEAGKPSFLWSPSVGAVLSNGLDLSVKYENIKGFKELRQVAVRAAFAIDTKKMKLAPKSDQGTGWELNASVNPGITLDQGHYTIGADFQLERYVSPKVALTLSAGFTHFDGRDFHYTYEYLGKQYNGHYNIDRNMIPVKAGVKVFVAPRVYAAGAAGIAIDINGNSTSVWSATLGYQVTKKFDIGIKYENYSRYSNTDQLSLRIGYKLF
jgi:hypothetical protein